MRFCGDGRLEIENSAAERALRAVALGRKNYVLSFIRIKEQTSSVTRGKVLFAGSF